VIESINQEKVMFTFARLDRLPPYVFATVNEIKMEARNKNHKNCEMLKNFENNEGAA